MVVCCLENLFTKLDFYRQSEKGQLLQVNYHFISMW